MKESPEGSRRAFSFCHRCDVPTGLHRVEGLLQVVDDVGDIFGPDRQADEVGSHAGALLLVERQLLVRGAVRVDDQRLAVADVGQVREQLHVVNELDAVLALLLGRCPGDAEAEHSSRSLGHVLLRHLVAGV